MDSLFDLLLRRTLVQLGSDGAGREVIEELKQKFADLILFLLLIFYFLLFNNYFLLKSIPTVQVSDTTTAQLMICSWRPKTVIVHNTN